MAKSKFLKTNEKVCFFCFRFGTVALPGISTATGCVGGAVFGAAGGFVEGAVYSVASQLLQNCFR
jgi:hypothetical protein